MTNADKIESAEFHTRHKGEQLSAAMTALMQLTQAERRLVARAASSRDGSILTRYVYKYRDRLYRNLGL